MASSKQKHVATTYVLLNCLYNKVELDYNYTSINQYLILSLEPSLKVN